MASTIANCNEGKEVLIPGESDHASNLQFSAVVYQNSQ